MPSLVKKTCLTLFALSLCLLLVRPSNSARADDEKEPAPVPPVRICMVKTLYTDVSPFEARFQLAFTGAIIKKFTGIEGQMSIGDDALSVARDLHDGKIDVAVFHGIEFAWAQQRYNDLRVVAIAVTKYRHAQAKIVVRNDSPAKSFADLKGKSLAVPQRSREHIRLFLTRLCAHAGAATPQAFFGKIDTPSSTEDALDEVLDKNQAAVVDAVALEGYADIKPGCYARLRVLQESELFPTGAIAYRVGGLDGQTVAKFREGLIDANQTDEGKELMRLARLTAFEPVPAEYTQMLRDIIKIYPSPR